jgi:hypothetical protein
LKSAGQTVYAASLLVTLPHPVVLAEELGAFERQGLDVEIRREVSWANATAGPRWRPGRSGWKPTAISAPEI